MKLGHLLYYCVSLLTLFLCGCNQSGANRSENSEPVSATEKSTLILKIADVQSATIDLGQVLPDSKSQRTFSVVNKTNREIVLDRFQSTCECTEIIGLPLTVPAGQSAELTVASDQNKEPGFIGSLAIAIDLFEKDQVRGKIEVQVTVSKDVGSSQKNISELDPKDKKENKTIQSLPDSPSNSLLEPTLAPPRPDKTTNP